MRKFKRMFLFIMFVFVFLPIPQTYAFDKDGQSSDRSKFSGEKRERMGKRIQEIYNQLDLTEEQKQQLEANKQKNREQRKAFFEQMKSSRKALNQELMKPTLDMDTINNLQSQFKTVQSQIADDRFNSILEVRKILTPEQFSKFITLMEEKKHKGPQQEEQ